MTVTDQRLNGQADPKIADICRDERRILISLDLDFSDIRTYPPANYSGIVVLRPSVQSIGSIRRLVAQVAATLLVEQIEGCLWIVDDGQIRVRTGGKFVDSDA